MASEMPEDEMCMECTVVSATCQCLKCECHLCDDCFDKVHSQFKYTRTHTKEPLDKPVSHPVQNAALMCAEHADKPIEYYCDDDHCDVCSHCVIVGRHRGHKISTIEEQKEKILAIVTKAQQMLSSCQQSEQLLDELQRQAKSNEAATIKSIELHFEQLTDKLLSAINTRQQLLVGQISGIYETHETKLQLIRNRLSKSQNYLKQLIAGDHKTMLSIDKKFNESIPCVVTCGDPFLAKCCFDDNCVLQAFDQLGSVECTSDVQINIVADNLVFKAPSEENVSLKMLNGTTNKPLSCVVSKPEHSSLVHSSKQPVTPRSHPAAAADKDDRSVPKMSLPDSLANFTADLKSGDFSQLVSKENSCSESSSVSNQDLSISDGLSSEDVSRLARSLVARQAQSHLPKDLPSSEDVKKLPIPSVTAGETRQRSVTDAGLSYNGACGQSKDMSFTQPAQADIPKQSRQSQSANSSLCSDGKIHIRPPPAYTQKLADSFGSGDRKNDEPAHIRPPPTATPKFAQSANRTTGSADTAATWEKVFLTNIRHPGYFTVQYERDLCKLKELMDEINEQCGKQTTVSRVKHIEPGTLVLAKFTDMRWYRAQVLRIVGHQLEVRFIDYGNTEFVANDGIQDIQQNFFKYPNMSSLCALEGIEPCGGPTSEWTHAAISTFARMTSNKQMMMKIVKQTDELIYVELAWCATAADIIPDCRLEYVSDALSFIGLASRTTAAIARQSTQSRYHGPDVPECGRNIKVNISYLLPPNQFAVQLRQANTPGTGIQQLDNLMSSLQSAYSVDSLRDDYMLHVPQKGMPVAAQFSVDNLWYRAEVVDVMPGGLVKVLYVDYGNSEAVPVSSLRKLLTCFLKLPVQALYCMLTFVSSMQYDVICDAYSKGPNSPIIGLTVTDILSGPILLVSMANESRPVSRMSSAAATPPRPAVEPPDSAVNSSVYRVSTPGDQISPRSMVSPRSVVSPRTTFNGVPSTPSKSSSPAPGSVNQARNLSTPVDNSRKVQYVPVFISHVVSPGELYFQLIRDKPVLDKLMAELTTIYGGSKADPNVTWVKGQNCVVHRFQDSLWYRAVILDINNDDKMVKVLMGDYGYREWVDVCEVRSVNTRFSTKNWFAMHCQLAGIHSPSSGGDWSQSACEAIYEMACGKKLFMHLKATTSDSSCMVYLLEKEIERGGALSPDRENYISLASVLVEDQLALPLPDDGSGDHAFRGRIRASSTVSTSSMDSQPLASQSSSSRAALPDVHYKEFLPAAPPTNDTMAISVTHVTSDGVIYVQDVGSDLSTFTKIINRVKVHYANSKPQPSVIWKIGCPVAAHFDEDGKSFYRAKVVGFSENGVEVLFVDFGNTEVIPKEDLRFLVDEFMLDPIMCYACRLNDVIPANGAIWDESFSTSVTTIAEGQAHSIDIQRIAEDGTLYVDFKLANGRDLGDVLCEFGLAKRVGDDTFGGPVSSESTEMLSASSTVPLACTGSSIPDSVAVSPYPPRVLPSIGDYLCVTVTQVDSPSVVYLQHTPTLDNDDASQPINNELKRLEEMSVTYKAAADYPPLSDRNLHPGAACVVQYSLDKHWYRGEIINIMYDSDGNETGQFGVRFVDYGTFEYVPRTRLRELPVDHIFLPVQAMRCNLAGISPPKDKQMSVDAAKQLMILFDGRPLTAVVKSVSRFDFEITADLYDTRDFGKDGANVSLVYKQLIDAGLLEQNECSSSGSLSDDDDDELRELESVYE